MQDPCHVAPQQCRNRMAAMQNAVFHNFFCFSATNSPQLGRRMLGSAKQGRKIWNISEHVKNVDIKMYTAIQLRIKMKVGGKPNARNVRVKHLTMDRGGRRTNNVRNLLLWWCMCRISTIILGFIIWDPDPYGLLLDDPRNGWYNGGLTWWINSTMHVRRW